MALTMLDDGSNVDTMFRLVVMQKIAHDLRNLFGTETQLPLRLQILLQKLEERQQQNS
jgi:hypothetical protein